MAKGFASVLLEASMVVPHHQFESLLKKKIIKFYDQGAQHILSMGGTRHKLGNTNI
jgi:hypothetical protein